MSIYLIDNLIKLSFVQLLNSFNMGWMIMLIKGIEKIFATNQSAENVMINPNVKKC